MELAKHTMNQHIDKNYRIIEFDAQTVFELQNQNGKILKTEMTKEQADKKYGFRNEY
jgi:hypothetical protein